MTRPRVAIAGARGFVGSALTGALAPTHDVVGLTRSLRTPPAGGAVAEWRSCDLFSLKDAEAALAGADYAYYLVHSMSPSGGLTQGDFRDFDLIAADNFARAAARAGLRQIVYLGGLVPPAGESGGKLSSHLASRLEVERQLAAYGTPVTALRAGLVVGAGGSSFLILARLVQRLPAMICPGWTDTPTQPIALEDALALLRYSLGRPELYGRSFDIGGPETLTYRKMIAITAELLGRKPRLLAIPFFTTRLSELWVRLVTGAPRELIHPLVESLHHSMVARDRELQDRAGIPGVPFRAAAREALAKLDRRGKRPAAFRAPATSTRDVRSVQRLPLPPGRNADWVAREYLRWLPHSVPGLLRVEVSADYVCSFFLRGFRKPVLVLAYAPERSHPDRALFYIRGGWLARVEGRGRLEFREVGDGHSLLAAVHEFRPRLPWMIYRWTQARVHLGVMWAFGRHLARGAEAAT